MAAPVRQDQSLSSGEGVPCSHCVAAIPAESFEYAYWTAAKQLLSAWCPSCHRRVRISARSWRQASGLHDLQTA